MKEDAEYTKKYTTWTPGDEIKYVKYLGTGKWHQGSDLRHTREWWMRQYIKLNRGREEPFVLAGLLEANRILSEEIKKP